MSERKKYTDQLPLTKAKIEDLRYLAENLIPKLYQDNYWNAILGGPTVENMSKDDDDDDDIGGFGDIYE